MGSEPTPLYPLLLGTQHVNAPAGTWLCTDKSVPPVTRAPDTGTLAPPRPAPSPQSRLLLPALTAPRDQLPASLTPSGPTATAQGPSPLAAPCAGDTSRLGTPPCLDSGGNAFMPNTHREEDFFHPKSEEPQLCLWGRGNWGQREQNGLCRELYLPDTLPASSPSRLPSASR